jgi:hypothetical protein
MAKNPYTYTYPSPKINPEENKITYRLFRCFQYNSMEDFNIIPLGIAFSFLHIFLVFIFIFFKLLSEYQLFSMILFFPYVILFVMPENSNTILIIFLSILCSVLWGFMAAFLTICLIELIKQLRYDKE